jgi:hypothetical protein
MKKEGGCGTIGGVLTVLLVISLVWKCERLVHSLPLVGPGPDIQKETRERELRERIAGPRVNVTQLTVRPTAREIELGRQSEQRLRKQYPLPAEAEMPAFRAWLGADRISSFTPPNDPKILNYLAVAVEFAGQWKANPGATPSPIADFHKEKLWQTLDVWSVSARELPEGNLRNFFDVMQQLRKIDSRFFTPEDNLFEELLLASSEQMSRDLDARAKSLQFKVSTTPAPVSAAPR